jgi:hypothetical protein
MTKATQMYNKEMKITAAVARKTSPARDHRPSAPPAFRKGFE